LEEAEVELLNRSTQLIQIPCIHCKYRTRPHSNEASATGTAPHCYWLTV